MATLDADALAHMLPKWDLFGVLKNEYLNDAHPDILDVLFKTYQDTTTLEETRRVVVDLLSYMRQENATAGVSQETADKAWALCDLYTSADGILGDVREVLFSQMCRRLCARDLGPWEIALMGRMRDWCQDHYVIRQVPLYWTRETLVDILVHPFRATDAVLHQKTACTLIAAVLLCGDEWTCQIERPLLGVLYSAIVEVSCSFPVAPASLLGVVVLLIRLGATPPPDIADFVIRLAGFCVDRNDELIRARCEEIIDLWQASPATYTGCMWQLAEFFVRDPRGLISGMSARIKRILSQTPTEDPHLLKCTTVGRPARLVHVTEDAPIIWDDPTDKMVQVVIRRAGRESVTISMHVLQPMWVLIYKWLEVTKDYALRSRFNTPTEWNGIALDPLVRYRIQSTPPPSCGIQLVGSVWPRGDVPIRGCDSLYELCNGGCPDVIDAETEGITYGGTRIKMRVDLPAPASWTWTHIFPAAQLPWAEQAICPEYVPYLSAMLSHLLDCPDISFIPSTHPCEAIRRRPDMVNLTTRVRAFLSRGRALKCAATPKLDIFIHRTRAEEETLAFFASRLAELDVICFHYVDEPCAGNASTLAFLTGAISLYSDSIDWATIRNPPGRPPRIGVPDRSIDHAFHMGVLFARCLIENVTGPWLIEHGDIQLLRNGTKSITDPWYCPVHSFWHGFNACFPRLYGESTASMLFLDMFNDDEIFLLLKGRDTFTGTEFVTNARCVQGAKLASCEMNDLIRAIQRLQDSGRRSLLYQITGRSHLPFNGFDGCDPQIKIALSNPAFNMPSSRCVVDQEHTTLYIGTAVTADSLEYVLSHSERPLAVDGSISETDE
jgi:hypothetical protein